MNSTPPTSSSLLRGLGLLPKKQAAFLSTFPSHRFLLLVLEAAVPLQIPAGCHWLFSCNAQYETPMALAEGRPEKPVWPESSDPQAIGGPPPEPGPPSRHEAASGTWHALRAEPSSPPGFPGLLPLMCVCPLWEGLPPGQNRSGDCILLWDPRLKVRCLAIITQLCTCFLGAR